MRSDQVAHPARGPVLVVRAEAPAVPAEEEKFFRRKKVCKFCTEKIDAIPYRDVRLLQQFVAERGKIVPRRLSVAARIKERAGS